MSDPQVKRGGLAPYQEVEYRRKRLSERLARDLITHLWLQSVKLAIDTRLTAEPELDPHEAMPLFPLVDDEEQTRLRYNYLGGESMYSARRHREEVISRTIDDDQFKSFVEDVLKDDLEKYGAKLAWYYRSAWDGQDRILVILPRD